MNATRFLLDSPSPCTPAAGARAATEAGGGLCASSNTASTEKDEMLATAA
jgi:hypothetical protein